ncbi:MAG: hypothetical protein WCC97_10780 [Candidatus Acidiferrales bacterium]
MKHTVTKPGQWPYIETLTRKARVKGVTITVTAKLVVRAGWAND